MRITDIDLFVLRAPGTYGAGGKDKEVQGLEYTCVVEVKTDEGVSGIAQVETQPHVVRACLSAPSETTGLFSGLRELALGADPRQVEALWDRLFTGSLSYGRRGVVLQAISAIDIACWDILGKATGLPVATLLGGIRRRDVAVYASTLFRDSSAEMYEVANAYVERGFSAVKFGWGSFGEDLSRDVSLVEAARDALGEDRQLMVDVGYRKRRTLKEALALVMAIDHCRPYWVEEPLFPEDYDTYRKLAELVSVPIAAGEAEATTYGFHQLIERGGIDIAQPDLSRCGGLTIARRIAYMAEDLNVAVCPHAWGSDILTAATLQFIAWLPRQTFLEFNTSADPLSRDLIKEPFVPTDGVLRLPDGPGLGIDLNRTTIESLRVG